MSDKLSEQYDDKVSNDSLNRAIRAFIKRFEPEDRRERYDFEMALHEIVRAIYREAVKPYEKALLGAAMLKPAQTVIFEKTVAKPVAKEGET